MTLVANLLVFKFMLIIKLENTLERVEKNQHQRTFHNEIIIQDQQTCVSLETLNQIEIFYDKPTSTIKLND